MRSMFGYPGEVGGHLFGDLGKVKIHDYLQGERKTSHVCTLGIFVEVQMCSDVLQLLCNIKSV